MSIADALLPEFDQEMASTRRVIERVPTDKGLFKPHPKSFSLAHLTQLVSGMPGWITNAITQTSLNLAGYPGYSNEKTEDLLKTFDRNVREARQAIAAAKDSDYGVNWSLKRGDQVFFTAPRAVIVRRRSITSCITADSLRCICDSSTSRFLRFMVRPLTSRCPDCRPRNPSYF